MSIYTHFFYLNILHDTYVIQLLLYLVVKVCNSSLDSKLLPQFKKLKI